MPSDWWRWFRGNPAHRGRVVRNRLVVGDPTSGAHSDYRDFRRWIKKQNRRVRFEFQAESECLRRLCPELAQRGEALRLLGDVTFSRVFGEAARVIVERFQTVIDQWTAARSTEDGTAFEFICAVCSCFRDDARPWEIMDRLVADQTVPPSVGQATLARLRERGVIEQSLVRGVHPISRRFVRAAQFLGTTPGFFSRSGGSVC